MRTSQLYCTACRMSRCLRGAASELSGPDRQVLPPGGVIDPWSKLSPAARGVGLSGTGEIALTSMSIWLCIRSLRSCEGEHLPVHRCLEWDVARSLTAHSGWREK